MKRLYPISVYDKVLALQLPICPYCGNETEDLNYCGECGRQLREIRRSEAKRPKAALSARAILPLIVLSSAVLMFFADIFAGVLVLALLIWFGLVVYEDLHDIAS